MHALHCTWAHDDAGPADPALGGGDYTQLDSYAATSDARQTALDGGGGGGGGGGDDPTRRTVGERLHRSVCGWANNVGL